MDKASLQKRIVELHSEIETRRSSIKELKQKKSVQERSETRSPGNIQKLERWLTTCDKINGVSFRNENVSLLPNGASKYITDLVSGSTTIHATVIAKEEENQWNILSLEATMEDPFCKAETTSWIHHCKRERDFINLCYGLKCYANWHDTRENVVKRMKEEFIDHYEAERSEENGAYVIKAKTYASRLLFRCTWTLEWSVSLSTIIPSFEFRCNKRNPFFEENRYLFKQLISTTISTSSCKDTWEKISTALAVVKESSNSSSPP